MTAACSEENWNDQRCHPPSGSSAFSLRGTGHHARPDIVLSLLQTEEGASIARLMEATGWQAHSVRGFLSAVVRKKRGLNLVSEVSADGQRRYRIATPSEAVA